MFSAFTTVLLMWSLTSDHRCIDALEGILQTVLGHQQLFFWFPSLSNGQTEYKNQVMDTALQCLVSLLLGTMGCNGGEYAHNTSTIACTGLSHFQGGYGYQPPLFPALEKEAASPSAMTKPGLKLTLPLLWFVTRIATFPIRLSHRSCALVNQSS